MRPSLIVTGQHEALDRADFGLGEFPLVNLGLAGEEDPHVHVRKVAAAVRNLLVSAPHLLIVQGDTSSALGAALGGFAAGVPVAHVEAGLRTYDKALPWPEEEYRTAIDAKAALLFAPTDLAAANLASERVSGTVHVTGNTGIDALLAVERNLPSPKVRDRGNAQNPGHLPSPRELGPWTPGDRRRPGRAGARPDGPNRRHPSSQPAGGPHDARACSARFPGYR